MVRWKKKNNKQNEMKNSMNAKWLSNNEGIHHELPKRGPGHKRSAAKIWSIQKVQIRLQQFWVLV